MVNARLRRLGLLLLALLLGASAVAEEVSSPRLLMVLWRGETPAEHGFIDELSRQSQRFEIDRIDAGQDRTRLAQALWQRLPQLTEYDLVYSFGTTASTMVHSMNRGRVAQLYSMVSAPLEAGLVTAQGLAPITGTTDAVPASLKIATARQLFPIRHIGMLLNARERNARVQLEELEPLCERLGIELSVLRVAPETGSLAAQLARLQQQNLGIDTLYLPSDSYLISQATTIMAALRDTPYRVIAPTATFVREGALMAIAPDYEAMGRALARRLPTLLNSAGSPADLTPIGVDQPRVLYNDATRHRLGIEIPDALRGQLTAVNGR